MKIVLNSYVSASWLILQECWFYWDEVLGGLVGSKIRYRKYIAQNKLNIRKGGLVGFHNWHFAGGLGQV